MPTKHHILATAGHVDHGKSSLIKALSGTDPDRLPEEKKRGLTIDLGFAHLEVRSPHDPSTLFRLGIVDVPGHEDFVKNMVAGVGSVDLALFVVAADDEWMPQSEEHLQILTYLGVKHAVIALTKWDIVDGKEGPLVMRLQERLHDTPLAGSPIVKTSTETGEGLEELKSTIAEVLTAITPACDIGKPRLSVDRVFSMHGIGTVVTGTLTGGSFRRGQSVVIQPRGREIRIRNLQSHGQDVELSNPGTRTALNLPKVSRASTEQMDEIRRGDVITLPGLGSPFEIVDVILQKSTRLKTAKTKAARPLKSGTRVRIHHGTSNIPARVLLRQCEKLHPGQNALAQLRMEAPLFAYEGDHFILRDWSEQATLAGGIVLNVAADARPHRDSANITFLTERAENLASVQTWIETQISRAKAVSRSELLVQTVFSESEISGALESFDESDHLIIVDDLIVDGEWWKTLRKRAADAIDAEHREHPERAGLTLSKFRKELQNERLTSPTFNALVSHLIEHGFRKMGIFFQRESHRPSLPPHLEDAATRIRAVLNKRTLDPPSIKQLAPEPLTQQALRFLLQTGEAVEISESVVISERAYSQAREKVVDFLRRQGPATVSQIRQELGSSRRIVVPLLEKFDRDGLTQRHGDARVLQ